jgi:outer membrane protein insertion porin family
VDIGALQDASFRKQSSCTYTLGNGSVVTTSTCEIEASPAPRIGAGVGISWRTAFGLINVDLTPFVLKQPGDQTQIFRFGFGTRF